jgi:hypothetical protein
LLQLTYQSYLQWSSRHLSFLQSFLECCILRGRLAAGATMAQAASYLPFVISSAIISACLDTVLVANICSCINIRNFLIEHPFA